METKSTNDTYTSTRNHRLMPELLALVYIRDMYFNDRSLYRPDGILKRKGCMCVSSGVQHYAIVIEPNFMKLINHFTFHI